MKFDVLDPFREYLKENLNDNTARTYFTSVVKIFQNKQFNQIGEISKEYLEEELKKIKTKNEFSAAKNALLHMKDYYPDLDIPDQEFFKQTSLKKRNRSKKPKKNIYLDETYRKINQISDDKFRYAYRLALASGLRVSDLADLEKEDITYQDNKIIVEVRNGKGGSNGAVECKPDPYLYKNLQEYTNKLNPGEKLFYSEVYLREKADSLNMECHDLRRIFAITTRNELKKEMPVYEANQIVQERLRHKRFSTTKRYLFNKKLVVRRKEGEQDEREGTK